MGTNTIGRNHGGSRFKRETSSLKGEIFRATQRKDNRVQVGGGFQARATVPSRPSSIHYHVVTHPPSHSKFAIATLHAYPRSQLHLPSSHAPLVARRDRWEILKHLFKFMGLQAVQRPRSPTINPLHPHTWCFLSRTSSAPTGTHSCWLVLVASGSKRSTRIGFR